MSVASSACCAHTEMLDYNKRLFELSPSPSITLDVTLFAFCASPLSRNGFPRFASQSQADEYSVAEADVGILYMETFF